MEQYKIHFEERWEEDLTLSELECEDWLYAMKKVIDDESLTYHERLQKIIDGNY